MNDSDINNNTSDIYDFIYEDQESVDDVDENWTHIGNTEKEIELMISLIPQNGKILDIGCGSGRHLIPISQKGVDIIGVETSQGMISILKSKYPEAKVLFRHIPVDPIWGKFDLIIIMWSSLSEIAYTHYDLEKILIELKNLLSPNGKILIDSYLEDKEDPSKSIETYFEKQKDNKKYTVTWTLKSYDEENHITVCEEKIEIKNEVNNENKVITSEIKQKWWRKEEIINASTSLGFATKIISLPDKSRKYFLLSIKS